METKNLIYSLKNAVIGDKKRSVLVIDKNKNSKTFKESGKQVISPTPKNVLVRKCSGCSRKRRQK